MVGERAKKNCAVDDGRVPLEVVERHVGIGRRRQLGEQAWKYRGEQFGVAGRRRERVEVGERGGRRGEPVPAQRRVMPLRGGAGRGQDRREVDGPVQMADSPVSPVRMRTASSMGRTNTLPSPMEPVLAAAAMVEVTLSAR